jgi:predicted outer membrane repeat protein
MLLRLSMLVALIAAFGAVTNPRPVAALAATYVVCPSGCDFDSVQAAVDATATGDTVEIASGVYPAQLTIRGKSLTLQGAGVDETILDGEQTGRVLVVEGSANVTLRNLTVRNGRAVAGSSFPAGHGGGIFIAAGGTLTMSEIAVTGNTAEVHGGGIANGGTLSISQSEISGNHTDGSGGGLFNTSRLNLYASDISANHSARSGGGIYSTDRLSVTESSITDNTAVVGGGLFNDGAVGETGNADLLQVVLDNNRAIGHGGGLYNAAGGTLTVSQSTVTGNYAGGRGGGLYTDSASAFATSGVIVSESSLDQNQAGDRGGGLYWVSGTLLLPQTVLWSNQPDDCAPDTVTCP